MLNFFEKFSKYAHYENCSNYCSDNDIEPFNSLRVRFYDLGRQAALKKILTFTFRIGKNFTYSANLHKKTFFELSLTKAIGLSVQIFLQVYSLHYAATL